MTPDLAEGSASGRSRKGAVWNLRRCSLHRDRRTSSAGITNFLRHGGAPKNGRTTTLVDVLAEMATTGGSSDLAHKQLRDSIRHEEDVYMRPAIVSDYLSSLVRYKA